MINNFVLLASQLQINLARGAVAIIAILLVAQILIRPDKKSDHN